ncbi:MAG: hypothetical protein JSS72_08240 [Armatimonadetes bacterium]|nr:hypothetical protein [Armatimonadota bacterium]
MSIVETPNRPTISDVLFESRLRDFSTLAHLPSNIDSIELALLFATGRQRRAALIGPSGWGKSHILEAVLSRLEKDGVRADITRAIDWLSPQSRSELSEVLIVDDLQDVLEGQKMRQQLRFALERRVRAGKPTLLSLTSTRSVRHLRNFLPYPKDWAIGYVPEATENERIVVLEHMARTEGLTVDPTLIRLLAARLHRNGRTLIGALLRLKLSGNFWVGEEAILRGLATLEMFFPEGEDAELRNAIVWAAQSQDFRKSGLDATELAIYGMLRCASIPENAVARYFDLEPASCFYIANKIEKVVSQPAGATLRSMFISKVVARLSYD